jgi:U32 family peptidase
MEKRTIPELLAPAGSIEALKAAVNAGADAVYLSGKSFGARQHADNFDYVQMKDAVDYAHIRDIKVYITVNTLVKDSELEEVAEYLLWLYQIGADAVILQDVGVASLCRELVPDMDMHASTQMTINSTEGVGWASDFGFKRVVLARELSLLEIEEIVHKTGPQIELEIFVHGALCYCYSGQCLLSSVIGGRSGNRGRCAQPCRKPYNLIQGEKDPYGKLINPQFIPIERYLLSTRDLCLYNKLNEISRLPLHSLKIEGRMRSPEYVAIVVSIYRKALNSLKQGGWASDDIDYFNLKLAFNRGFTRGYMYETSAKSLMGREAPGNRGLYLGTVIGSQDGRKTIIHLDSQLYEFYNQIKLEKGDGIVFILPNATKNEYGLVIDDEPEYQSKSHHIVIDKKKTVPSGSKVYLTRHVSLLKSAERTIGGDKKYPPIPLDMSIRWNKKSEPILEGIFKGNNGKEHIIHYKSDLKMKPALKRPLSKEQIINQLIKTGGTPFNVRTIEISYPGNLFTPISKLNELRRKFIAKAYSMLLNDYKPLKSDVNSALKCWEKIKQDLKPITPNFTNLTIDVGESENKRQKSVQDVRFPLDIAVYASCLETVRGALNAGCKRIYFEPVLGEKNGIKEPYKIKDWEIYAKGIHELLMDAHELCIAEEAVFVWKWPAITRNIWIKNLLPLIKSFENKDTAEIMIDNLGALRVIKNFKPSITISGSAGLNIWNHRTALEFSNVLSRLTLSNELSKEKLVPIIRYSAENTCFDFVVQGNLESMVSEDHLLRARLIGNKIHNNHFYGIKDVKKRIFPVRTDDEGRTYISNSVELCLIDYIPDLYQIGLQHLVIDTRNKPGKYAQTMVAYYLKGLKYGKKSDTNRKNLERLKNKVKKISQGGITTGNFIKGLRESY